MTTNPYAFEPEEDRAAAAKSPLYSIRGVGVATFFGSMIAGAIVIAISLFRLGRKRQAWIVIIGSVVAFAAFLVCMFTIPALDDLPSSAFTIPQIFLMVGVARQLYGEELTQREQSGEAIASAWRGFGIGLATGVLMAATFIGTLLVVEDAPIAALFENYGTEVRFGDNSVYIEGDASRADAELLASHFLETGTFDDAGIDVKLKKQGRHTEVSFVIVEQYRNDEATIEGFQYIADDLLAEDFGETVEVHLCDDYFTPEQTIVARHGEEAEDDLQ